MTKPAYKIRKATSQDARDLSEFGARTFYDSFGEQNRPENIAAYIRKAFSLPQIQTEVEDAANHFLLAISNRKMIGYTKLSANDPPSCVQFPNPLELARIYVDQVWTRMGIGSALMQASMDTATLLGYKAIWLGVWQENPKAIKFYTSWGFSNVGTQHFLMGSDLQDDFVLARSLP